MRKMPKKPFPRMIAGSACAIMLAASLFSRSVSSISLMLIAGGVSLVLFCLNRKGGCSK